LFNQCVARGWILCTHESPRRRAYKVDVPVMMLKIDDGRVAFDSIFKMRM